MNIDDILENLFTPEEFDLFEDFKNVDVNKLKEIGHVEETTITENGITQDKVIFNSFDGKHSFTKTNSYFDNNALYEKIKELNQRITNAVKNEDYILAAKYKEHKDGLVANSN